MESYQLWFESLPPNKAALIFGCLSALIAAVVTLLTGWLRDFLSKSWSDKRESKKSAAEVFRRYADPLVKSTSSLYWRLDEMTSRNGRSSFLVAKEPRSTFDEYKLKSTYYRLATVLGWLSILRRELSFFRTYDQRRIGDIDIAISNFEKSLADGHEVEMRRLHGLQQLWNIPRIDDADKEEAVAIAVDDINLLRLHEKSQISVQSLDNASQIALCSEISNIITCKFNKAKIQAGILKETHERSIAQIDIKEAWLYRDWQTAIGDMMIRKADSDIRIFEIVGYGEFEEMLLNPSSL